MAFKSFNEPGEVLTSQLSFEEMDELLQQWRVTVRRELVADAEGMPAGNDTGEVYRRVENALRILELARRGEQS